MPWCKFAVGKMLEQDAVGEIENISLSISAINRRIDDMSHNAEELARDERRHNSFSIQADESHRFHKLHLCCSSCEICK
jgi:hypothetical protein